MATYCVGWRWWALCWRTIKTAKITITARLRDPAYPKIACILGLSWVFGCRSTALRRECLHNECIRNGTTRQCAGAKIMGESA
ncbi:hypothetical protein DFH29DRAFT_904346 [Suillus ampliporus]|nr:hypothetical protein DFH29DRAFT_904346 [Suillus ampliporus]